MRSPEQSVSDITRKSRSNFYYSFMFLPKAKREAIHTVYSFCRISDDIVDDDAPLESRADALTHWESQFLSGPGKTAHPLIQKVYDVMDRFHIPARYFVDVIQGMRMDLTKQEYRTFAELREYAYYVASVVGLICIEIFHYRDPETRVYAEHLGVALQLTNIMRDAHEDAKNGRLYLPEEDLKQFDYHPDELKNAVYDDRFLAMMEFQYKRALDLYQQAVDHLPETDRKSMMVAEMMRAIYFKLLQELKQQNFQIFQNKIRVSTPRKLSTVFKTYLNHQFMHA